MLHILLLILKIIGIILAVILGILVLLVCIVVFVPVRYEINGRAGGKLSELRIKGKVTWLFSLVRADVYFKENKLKWRLGIAWKKNLGGQEYGADLEYGRELAKDFYAQNKRTEGEEDEEIWKEYGGGEEGEGGEESDGKAWRDEAKEGEDGKESDGKAWRDEAEEGEGGKESAEKAWREGAGEGSEDEEDEKSHKEAWRAESGRGKESRRAGKDVKRSWRWSGRDKKKGRKKQGRKKALDEFGEDEEIVQEIFEGFEEEYPGSKEETFRRRGADEGWDGEDGGRIRQLIGKIKEIYRRIKCTIRGICDKIKELLEKKNRLLEFIRDDTHVRAFEKVKKEVFKLIKRMKPKKLLLEAEFGFDDPSWTGRALAWAAPFYPYFGEAVLLHPDFTQKTLKGRMQVKGHVRFCHFAALAWNLFWSRHVRRTYKDIRNFKI